MDDRPLKILARADVAHKELLQDMVRAAQVMAESDNVDLQYEFGPTVAVIRSCNQFLRLHRDGEHVGHVELWLPEEAKTELAGHTELLPPDGAVFRMFGWIRIDPCDVPEKAWRASLRAAYQRAGSKQGPGA